MSDFKKRAVDLSFDLSKQFISLAFAGVAFAVGLSAGNGLIVGSVLFWVVLTLFGASSIFGFVYLLRGASRLSSDKEFDIYESVCRWMAILQIVFVFVGVFLLLFLHLSYRKRGTDAGNGVDILVNSNKVHYAVPVGKDIKLTIDNGGNLDFQTISPTHGP
jgi:hypothetical protein